MLIEVKIFQFITLRARYRIQSNLHWIYLSLEVIFRKLGKGRAIVLCQYSMYVRGFTFFSYF